MLTSDDISSPHYQGVMTPTIGGGGNPVGNSGTQGGAGSQNGSLCGPSIANSNHKDMLSSTAKMEQKYMTAAFPKEYFLEEIQENIVEDDMLMQNEQSFCDLGKIKQQKLGARRATQSMQTSGQQFSSQLPSPYSSRQAIPASLPVQNSEINYSTPQNATPSNQQSGNQYSEQRSMEHSQQPIHQQAQCLAFTQQYGVSTHIQSIFNEIVKNKIIRTLRFLFKDESLNKIVDQSTSEEINCLHQKSIKQSIISILLIVNILNSLCSLTSSLTDLILSALSIGLLWTAKVHDLNQPSNSSEGGKSQAKMIRLSYLLTQCTSIFLTIPIASTIMSASQTGQMCPLRQFDELSPNPHQSLGNFLQISLAPSGILALVHYLIDVSLISSDEDSKKFNVESFFVILVIKAARSLGSSFDYYGSFTLLLLAQASHTMSNYQRFVASATHLRGQGQSDKISEWEAIFAKLPIGIVISNGRQIVHSNQKLKEMTGNHNIKELEELDKYITIQEQSKDKNIASGLSGGAVHEMGKNQNNANQESNIFGAIPTPNTSLRNGHPRINQEEAKGKIIGEHHIGFTFESFSAPLNQKHDFKPLKQKQVQGRATRNWEEYQHNKESISVQNIGEEEKDSPDAPTASFMKNIEAQKQNIARKNTNGTSGLQKLSSGDSVFNFLLQVMDVAGKDMTIIIFVDITQQEKEYKTSLEQKYKNIFLSSVSHQLRTPLNILQMNNNILRDVLKDNDFVIDILESDQKTINLLNFQIADILDYSKIEADEFRLNTNEFNFRNLLKKIRNIFEPMACQKKLFFNMDIVDKVPDFILSDEQRLGQVLVNIIGNAVKFTFKGKVSINVTANERDSEIRVEVRDTGKGIEKLHQVGNFFGNLDIVEKVNQNGIGFGITISKKLMHKLGGDIYMQNAYNGQFGQVNQIIGLQVSIVIPWRQSNTKPESHSMRGAFMNQKQSFCEPLPIEKATRPFFNISSIARGVAAGQSTSQLKTYNFSLGPLGHMQQQQMDQGTKIGSPSANKADFLFYDRGGLNASQLSREKSSDSRKRKISMQSRSFNPRNLNAKRKSNATINIKSQNQLNSVQFDYPNGSNGSPACTLDAPSFVGGNGLLSGLKARIHNKVSAQYPPAMPLNKLVVQNMKSLLPSKGSSLLPFNDPLCKHHISLNSDAVQVGHMSEDDGIDDQPTVEMKVLNHTIKNTKTLNVKNQRGQVDSELRRVSVSQNFLLRVPETQLLNFQGKSAKDFKAMIRSSNTAKAGGNVFIHGGDDNIEEENTDNEFYSDTMSDEEQNANGSRKSQSRAVPKKLETICASSNLTKSKFFMRNMQKKLYRQLNSIKGSMVPGGVGRRKSNKQNFKQIIKAIKDSMSMECAERLDSGAHSIHLMGNHKQKDFEIVEKSRVGVSTGDRHKLQDNSLDRNHFGTHKAPGIQSNVVPLKNIKLQRRECSQERAVWAPFFTNPIQKQNTNAAVSNPTQVGTHYHQFMLMQGQSTPNNNEFQFQIVNDQDLTCNDVHGGMAGGGGHQQFDVDDDVATVQVQSFPRHANFNRPNQPPQKSSRNVTTHTSYMSKTPKAGGNDTNQNYGFNNFVSGNAPSGGPTRQYAVHQTVAAPHNDSPLAGASFLNGSQNNLGIESGIQPIQPCCKRILVVDDNPFNIKAIELMLEHCFKIRCDTAYSGGEALQLVEKRLEKLHKFGCSEYYRLILTDINMPEMDGIQMTKKIRQIYANNKQETNKSIPIQQASNNSSLVRANNPGVGSQIGRGGSNSAIMKALRSGGLGGSQETECVIWAITAMNETDIEDQVSEDCLNGISVKPMSYKQLSQLLFTLNLINYMPQSD